MSNPDAQVAIGLPVYNGARHLRQALTSILAQTYTDFELIISDNASTDDTEAICRHFAAQDRRIRYIRNPENIGAVANFNQTFRLSNHPYFKWIAADDVLHPENLQRCMEALAAQPDAVFAFTQVQLIDEAGTQLPYDAAGKAFELPNGTRFDYNEDCEQHLLTAHPIRRMQTVLFCNLIGTLIYGLCRTEALRRTNLFTFYGSDRLLLAELSLQGAFARVPEPLFYRRAMDHGTWQRTRRDWAAGITGRRPTGLLVPPWRTFRNYVGAVSRAPLPLRQKLLGWLVAGHYAVRLESLRNLFVPGPENYWGLHPDAAPPAPQPESAPLNLYQKCL